MVKKLIKNGKSILFSEQSSVLSAASLIMAMVIVAKVLGFIRQRVLFTHFSPAETDLFLAAFELPDILFEVLVFGTMSAAFIPVFSRYIRAKKIQEAWDMARSSLTIILAAYTVLSLIVFVFANSAYEFLAGNFFKDLIGVGGGFSSEGVQTVVSLTRILLFSQLFFVVSSFMTGILESHKRFLFPAIAPLVYNLGIIVGIVFLSPHYGLLGPVLGAFIGAFGHLLVQAPIAYHLGFRFKLMWNVKDEGVRELFKLAGPRILELSVFQIKRIVWLFLGSLAVGGFTYLKSADLLQTLPVSVFGISLAKAALPTLSQQASDKNKTKFKKTFFTTVNQILFLVIPLSALLIVLRVPVVRLVFGAEQFDWQATISTSYALSAFAIGASAYAASLLVTRAFYALHDTRTPVSISVATVFINAILGFVFVLAFDTGPWGIALSYSIAGIIQFILLLTIILRRLQARFRRFIVPVLKMIFAAVVSGLAMRFMIRLFDRSVWVKQLSFLSRQEALQALPFERFVLDTRYSGNLLILTVIVGIVGIILYFLILLLLRSEEVWTFLGFARRLLVKRSIAPIPEKEGEQIAPSPTDSTT